MSRFDVVVDRKNTDSLKYDFAREFGKPEDILPLWVADMDFKAPEAVLEALKARVEHGIFGYTDTKENYGKIVTGWFRDHHGWEADPKWLVKSPGVVFAINHAIRAFTKPGDGVLIQEPVYYPFAASIRDNERRVVNNQLQYIQGRYLIDFEDFEEKIQSCGVKLFLLCSPHNPVGRVWSREELFKMGEICLRHQVMVVSDEIHCDFTYPGHKHTVFASLSKAFEDNCIVCTAPSKTFNLASLQTSNIFIPNEDKRKAFAQQMRITGYGELNGLGPAACMAAYESGGPWLDELLQYLQGNLQFLREFLQKNIPGITLVEPEGTYLAWVDCSNLGLSDQELERIMVREAKLWLDGGAMFGKECGQFQRWNLACPRSVLKQALEQLKDAVIS